MTKQERQFAIDWAETYRLATWADAVATFGGYKDHAGRACAYGHVRPRRLNDGVATRVETKARELFGISVVSLNDNHRFDEVQAALDEVAYGGEV